MNSPLNIYNASAGSGKTYTLVKDLLAYLLSTDEPKKFQEVLAMTFTNKAAQEMKIRVLKELRLLADETKKSPYYQEFLVTLNVDEKKLQSRSERVLKEIIHNYSLFNISTIDTFNLRLMRSFAKDMGLSFNFDVEMETDAVIDEASKLFFSELQLNDELTQIIQEIALSKMELDRSWDISHELTKQAKNSFQDEFRAELERFHKKGISALNKYRKELKKEYFSIKRQIQDLSTKAINRIEEKKIPQTSFYQGSKGLPSFLKKNAAGTLTPPNNYVRKFFEEHKLTSAKATEVDSINLESIFNELEALYLQMNPKFMRFDLLSRIYQSINPLILLSELNNYVERLRQENNFLLISDFNKTIGQHLQEQPANFIYEKLGTRFKKFFIDEFQDTSKVQWDNLYPLLEDALSQNHEVALVGDPKQSIYRFRGGDLNLMIGLMAGESFPPHIESLDTNWRSSQEIIGFTNHFFTWIASYLPTPMLEDIYKIGNNQKTTSKKEGYVRVEVCDARGSELSVKELQLERMCYQIQGLQESNYPLNDIAILCRTRKEAVEVSEYLKKLKIPVISNESLLLIESPIIQLVQSFFKVYNEPNNPTFRFQLLSLLKMQGAISEEDFAPFMVQYKDNSLQEFLNALKKYGFNFNLNYLQNLSLYDLTEELIRVFNVESQDEIYVIRYLDEVLGFQQKQKGGVIEWVEYFESFQEKLSINLPEGNNAILVMTIHKSKGLEFPIVMLPFIDWGVKPDGIWVDLANEPIDRVYIEKTTKPEGLSEDVQQVINNEVAMATLDQLNVFYVATTRAEKQLYIYTPFAKDTSKWLHAALLNYVSEFGEEGIYEKGNFVPYQKKEDESHTNDLNEISLVNYSEAWQHKIMMSTEHADLQRERDLPRIKGSQVHKILEQIKHKDEAAKVLSFLVLEGVITPKQQVDFSTYLNQVFNHPKLTAFFEPLNVLNERDFVTSVGEVFRPDRLVEIEKNQWVLIDYKTGAKNASHASQLNSYAEELEKLGYPVVAKYVVYLHDQVEVDEIL